jgi:fructoselysine-6-P-deglycase FrlB-like protein
VEALSRHRGTGARTIAITNRPSSPLAEVADDVLPLLAGEERGGVACRTFQATLAALLRLAGVPTKALDAAPAAQAALLDARGAWLEALLHELDGAHTIYTIAPAARIASALQSALMFREGPRLAADGTETGDWLHVDVYLSKHPGYRALLFSGSRYDAGVMDWARQRASTIVAVGSPVGGAALHIALPADPVAELAAGTLWQRQS